MNVIGHGVDVVECDRIAELLERHQERFLNRILTPAERARADALRHPIPHISGRFAAKEAILKVLGTGWRGHIAWTDMEITNDDQGKPGVRLTGQCAKIAADLGIGTILLSISHTKQLATASAMGVSSA